MFTVAMTRKRPKATSSKFLTYQLSTVRYWFTVAMTRKKPKATSSKFLTYQLSTVLVYSGNDQEKAKSHQIQAGERLYQHIFCFGQLLTSEVHIRN